MANVALKPRTAMDRQLARIEQQIVWERASQSVRENVDVADRLSDLAKDALAIGEAQTATPTLKLRAIAVARDCLVSASDIRIRTIIDRTIPALQRSEVMAALQNLPPSSDEIDSNKKPIDPEEQKAKVLSALRDAVRVRGMGIVAAVPNGEALNVD